MAESDFDIGFKTACRTRKRHAMGVETERAQNSNCFPFSSITFSSRVIWHHTRPEQNSPHTSAYLAKPRHATPRLARSDPIELIKPAIAMIKFVHVTSPLPICSHRSGSQ